MSILPSLAEAVRLLEKGDLAGSEAAATAILAREASPDALHLLAVIRIQQNRGEDALSLLNRSLKARPGHPHVLLNLAKTQRLLGRGAEAAATLQAAIAAHPGLVEAWHELGMLKLQAGDNRGAQECLRQALTLDPGHLLARLWLGVSLRNDGQAGEAEKILAEGLARTEEPEMKAAFAYNLAQAHYSQGKKEAALAHFTLAARLDNTLGADVNRADVLEEMLRLEEAEAVLADLIQREPMNAGGHEAYNSLLHRLGRDSEFLKSYDKAPRDAALQTAKAGLLLKAGREEEAAAIFTAVAAADPGNLAAAIGGATALNELKRHGEAFAQLERALVAHPGDPALYQNLAATALRHGDPKKAQSFAEKSLILSPVDQAGLALLGLAWRMQEDERDDMLNGYDELIQIFDLPAPEGFSSMAAFNAELSGWLEARHPKTRAPLTQSLRGGSQTRGFMFGQGHELVEKLRGRIDDAIAQFIAGLRPDDRHPFRGRRHGGFRYADSWSSRLKDCGFHINHIHPGGWISSCYYVALPEVVKDQEQKQGWIKFGEPNFDVGLGIKRAIQPVPGRLVLFPSYMWHGTVPFHENAVRTTIAFDAVPRG